jgi:hypothetical protein
VEYCPGASTIFDSSVKSGDKPIKVNHREIWDGYLGKRKKIHGGPSEIQRRYRET